MKRPRRKTPREWFRWRIVATRLERAFWICWCDVVDWALQGDPDRRPDKDEAIGLIRQREAGALLDGILDGRAVERCKRDARREGACYCQKFLRADVAAEMMTDPIDPRRIVDAA